jgi:hypothetical protein
MEPSYEDLVSQYEGLYGKFHPPDRVGPTPMERLLELEGLAIQLMQDTVQWYLGKEDGFEFRRMVQEIRDFRDILADMQHLLEGIDLTDQPQQSELELTD